MDSRLCARDVRRNVLRVGIDPRDLFPLHSDHVRQLTKDLPQLGDRALDRFDRRTPRREVLVVALLLRQLHLHIAALTALGRAELIIGRTAEVEREEVRVLAAVTSTGLPLPLAFALRVEDTWPAAAAATCCTAACAGHGSIQWRICCIRGGVGVC